MGNISILLWIKSIFQSKYFQRFGILKFYMFPKNTFYLKLFGKVEKYKSSSGIRTHDSPILSYLSKPLRYAVINNCGQEINYKIILNFIVYNVTIWRCPLPPQVINRTWHFLCKINSFLIAKKKNPQKTKQTLQQ